MKHCIIRVGRDYQVKILSVRIDHKDAVEDLNDIISKNYKEDKKNTYHVYYKSKDCVAVYYNGYTGEYLDSKYYIVSYDENNFDD